MVYSFRHVPYIPGELNPKLTSYGESGLRIAHDKILKYNEADSLIAYLHRQVFERRGSDWASAHLDQLIIMALLSSGLRNSEFCALTINDTIMASGTSAFVVRRPAARKRTVYLPKMVSSLVTHYVEEIRPRFLPQGSDHDDWTKPLLMNEHRRAFDRTSLYRRVVKILTAAGLGERANVQLLRHTYGYLAYLRTGGNLLFVQRQLGHAHPATTSMYANLVDESYSDLAERILPMAGPMAATERRPSGKCVPRFDCEID